MFGMGFMEIFLIAVVAIIALGPEKLPSAMVDIAKMIKKLKGGLDDAKSTISEEMKISEMKEEANKFKAQFEDAKQSVSIDKNLGLEDLGLKTKDLSLDAPLFEDDEDDFEEKVKKVKKKKRVPLREKKKTAKKTEETSNEKVVQAENCDDVNKFKVDFDEKKDTKNEDA